MDLSLRRVPGPPCMRLTAVASKHAGNSFGMTKIADACLMCPCLLSTLLEYMLQLSERRMMCMHNQVLAALVAAPLHARH